jgi:hypothetical protein
MKSRNLFGLAALLLLLAAVFGGSLLCQPASERTTIPEQADRWREQPASAVDGEAGGPVRNTAEVADAAAVHDLVARVVDQDGRPILGAEVFLNWAEKPGAAAAARAYTGLDGSVRFERLPRARFRLQAVAEGFFPSAGTEEVAIPTPVLQEVELRLVRGGSVSGFVYGLDGFEVRFAWIRLRDLDTGTKTLARAAERGAFRSGALQRGAWEVAWVEHEQAEPDPRIVWSAVIEPGDHVELVVTLEQTTRGEPREGREIGIAPLRRGQ